MNYKLQKSLVIGLFALAGVFAIVLPLCVLIFRNVDDPLLEHYSEFLHVDSMLKYCLDDDVYNGKGRFYLDGNTRRGESISDDGQLCSALLSLDIIEKADGVQENRIENLTPLVNYYVPFDGYAFIIVYEGDILCCEIHGDIFASSYYRYFDMDAGKTQELYTLAIEIRDNVNQG